LAETLTSVIESTTAGLITRLHERHISYKKISQVLGVHWLTVSRWASGETHPRPAGPINQCLEKMLDEPNQFGIEVHRSNCRKCAQNAAVAG